MELEEVEIRSELWTRGIREEKVDRAWVALGGSLSCL